ncbi:MAG TPA: carboxypeptidase-like regulatory domain-containing protein [Terriglobales bacterium]|nr:carboxypeptidase-like regulatory domain-containing protein [Terriglobales bacterium]
MKRWSLAWWIVVLATALSSHAQKVKSAVVTGRITGTVVHAGTGRPLAGIDVSISPAEQRDLVTETTTGPDGRFAFENLARGKFSLIAQGSGFSEQAYQQHAPYSTAIAVGPGLASENLIFQLVPDGSISGSVQDEENETVRNGDVLLFSRDGATGRMELRARNTLEDQGRYHFGHLFPGTYFVAVSAQPWYAADPPGAQNSPKLSMEGENTADQRSDAPSPSSGDAALDVAYRVTFYADAVDAESATPIQLHAGERATADVTLRAVPAVHLTVRNASTDPNQPGSVGVQQRVFDRELIPIQGRTQPGPSGSLVVGGIPPGHVVVNLRTYSGKEWKNQARELDVASDSEIDTSENSTGAVYIRGTVHSPQPGPFPPGTYVRFFNRDTHEGFGAPVSDTGKFEFSQNLSSTSVYEVAVIHPRRAIVEKITASGAKVVGRTLTFPRNGTVDLTLTLLPGAGRIDGTVLREGKGVSQAMVVLVPQSLQGNADLFRRDQSDSDGTFSLYQVIPGRYTVVAIENGWNLDWQNPDVLRPYLEHGQSVEVPGSGTYKISVPAQASNGVPAADTQAQN